jgi:predicted nucleic acid-binding protein
MGWLTRLYGTIVGLDTAPLIYFVEENPAYLTLVDPFFEAMGRGDIQVVTSTLTLTEVLVHPYKRGNRALVDQYSQMLLNTRNLETLPVSPAMSHEAARLRATLGLKAPDSIQLATAKVGGATSFFSNDSELAAVPGIELVLLDRLLTTP